MTRIMTWKLSPISVNDTTDDNMEDFLHKSRESQSFPRRIACFTHNLQLVVGDGLKEAGQLKSVINKV